MRGTLQDKLSVVARCCEQDVEGSAGGHSLFGVCKRAPLPPAVSASAILATCMQLGCWRGPGWASARAGGAAGASCLLHVLQKRGEKEQQQPWCMYMDVVAAVVAAVAAAVVCSTRLARLRASRATESDGQRGSRV